MPNIKSAEKRVQVTEIRTQRNKAVKSNLKSTLKKAELAIAENAENKEEAVRLATKKIDQAAAKGIFHKNKAARKKSQIAKALNK